MAAAKVGPLAMQPVAQEIQGAGLEVTPVEEETECTTMGQTVQEKQEPVVEEVLAHLPAYLVLLVAGQVEAVGVVLDCLAKEAMVQEGVLAVMATVLAAVVVVDPAGDPGVLVA